MLNSLLGASDNRIRFLSRSERMLADALMAASILLVNYADLAKRVPWVLRHRKRPVSRLSLLRPYKYVRFNGSLFVDCFYPKFPGRVFDRLVGSLARNLVRPPEEWSPITFCLILSITSKCVYRCEHCYAIQTLGSRDKLSLDQLLGIARDFRRLGVGIIAWEGGEPLMRFDDLLTLIRAMRDETEALLATTAYGLTSEKASALREAGLVTAIVSLDHYDPDKHNAFRRNKRAFDMAVNGVRLFRENGILPSVCICATREIIDEGGLYRYLELAKEIGAAFIQILDATPSGNYLGKDVILSRSQLDEVRRFHLEVNTHPRYRDYPSISSRALLEDDRHYGCCAGTALCYVDSSGNLQACDLLQIAFGNVLEEGTEQVYRRMKAHFPYFLAGRCPAQTLQRDLSRVYARSGALPLPYGKCGKILEEIRGRGPAPCLR